MKRICIFCGANAGNRPLFAAVAKELGALIARSGRGVVYGGGNVGLMGAVADGALEQGGEVIGVIPRSLVDRELAHKGVSTLHIVGTMHERKALMADLSDAFIALPGGFGTLDEFFEILTWAQLGIHGKPVGLYNVDGYFDHLLAFLDRAVSEGLLQAQNRRMFIVEHQSGAVIDRLDAMALKPMFANGDIR
jgi:uncharacterized protein (TIGR00730 family)